MDKIEVTVWDTKQGDHTFWRNSIVESVGRGSKQLVFRFHQKGQQGWRKESCRALDLLRSEIIGSRPIRECQDEISAAILEYGKTNNNTQHLYTDNFQQRLRWLLKEFNIIT
jgi:hypothetical protein